MRPDLATEWDGRAFSSHAAHLDWSHNTTHLDVTAGYDDIGNGFRADTGFLPQVGYRKHYENGGWTLRPPSGFFRRVRMFVNHERQLDREGALVARIISPGISTEIRWNGSIELKYIDDRTRPGAGAPTIGRRQLGYDFRISPSRLVAEVSIDGTLGEEIDFANARPGHGFTINADATINPTDHLQLSVVQNLRQLDVDALRAGNRLFSANVSRIRGTYTFTARTFARVIGQYVSTTRDPALYLLQVPQRSGTFSGSALLAYKINWQSVLFVGYGDDRELSERHELEPASRQFFMKMSYAFQR